jgi:large subunit ribosomal protein L15
MAVEDKDPTETKVVKATRSRAKASDKASADQPAEPVVDADQVASPAKPTRAPRKATKVDAVADGAAKPASDKKPAAEKKPATEKKPAASDKKAAKAEPAEIVADAVVEDDTAVSKGPKSHLLKAHHLRPAPGAKKAKTRVGRGESSKGKTAGRGTKGTKARHNVPARLEGGQMPLHMRLPKLRGFKNRFRVEYQVVNLDKLGLLYPNGGQVTSADLVARGVVRDGYPVKVLGQGNVTVKLDVKVEALSAAARDKILAAGGSVGA